MQTLRLRTGIDGSELVVITVTITLKNLWDKGLFGQLAVCDLAMRCKDSSYPISKEIEEKLKNLSLIQVDGKVHKSIQDVVLASVEGEGLDMRLVSPLP